MLWRNDLGEIKKRFQEVRRSVPCVPSSLPCSFLPPPPEFDAFVRATANMVPLSTMEIFDTAPSLVSRGCSGWSDLGHQRLCLQLALEAGNGDGAAETKELVDRRRGHGCGRALTVRDARCGRLSETGAHPSRCERAGLFWWWPTSVPGCGQQRGELGVGRRSRAREQRKVGGRVNLRAWAADASRNGASNLVSVSGGLGAGSRA